MDVIAALAVALGAFDAKHVELAFEPFLGFATALGRRGDLRADEVAPHNNEGAGDLNNCSESDQPKSPGSGPALP